eukprot:gene13749-biopygen23070
MGQSWHLGLMAHTQGDVPWAMGNTWWVGVDHSCAPLRIFCDCAGWTLSLPPDTNRVQKRAWLRAPPNPFPAGALNAVWGTYVSMKGYGPLEFSTPRFPRERVGRNGPWDDLSAPQSHHPTHPPPLGGAGAGAWRRQKNNTWI